MSEYTAKIAWRRNGQTFVDNQYSRAHTWTFDGGTVVPGSSSPHVVALPFSDPRAVDPEEAFVASLSSCHMLWFFTMAVKRRLVVDSYVDDAIGVMEKNAEGKLAMTVVTLRPEVVFAGENQPTHDQIMALHHRAHEECFIANSVKTRVLCEPFFLSADRED